VAVGSHQVRTWPGKNVAVTWEFEPYEGLEQLWPDGAFQQYLAEPSWSKQTRSKYAHKRRVTMRHGGIACNETVPASTTANSFQCSDNHRTAEGCNFKCIPQTCVTQQARARRASNRSLERPAAARQNDVAAPRPLARAVRCSRPLHWPW
jgi:hypothetical protein